MLTITIIVGGPLMDAFFVLCENTLIYVARSQEALIPFSSKNGYNKLNTLIEHDV